MPEEPAGSESLAMRDLPNDAWPDMPESDILDRLVDTHCHPTDYKRFREEKMEYRDSTEDVSLSELCAMSSHLADQDLVKQLAQEHPRKVVPAFGLHPWWSHHLSLLPSSSSDVLDKRSHYSKLFPGYFDRLDDNQAAGASSSASSSAEHRQEVQALYDHLPDPIHLDEWIEKSLRPNLVAHPNAMLGEVGLDKSFRLPVPPAMLSVERTNGSDISQNAQDKTQWDTLPASRPKRSFTNLKVPMDHQVAFLRAQMEIALSLSRNISLHSVQAQGPTVDLLDSLQSSPSWRSSTSKICLHSYGGSVDTIARILRLHPDRVYFSFSTTINARLDRLEDLIRGVPKEKLLIESDFNDVRKQDRRVWEILGIVCQAKDWEKEEAADILRENWRRFRGRGADQKE